MKYFLRVGIALLLIVMLAMIWQHDRYQNFRQVNAQDRQAMFYSDETFHVLWFFELAPDQSLEPALRRFVSAVEQASGTAIYAGRAAGSTIVSNQLETSAWDAVLLAQFPSREAYDAASFKAERATFRFSHAQGVMRPSMLNLALPQMLLGVRLFDLITFKPSIFPVVPDPRIDPKIDRDNPKNPRMPEILEALREDAQEGVVFVNLIPGGSAGEQGAAGTHPRKMMRAMAEGGYGPLHMGNAVKLEGDAEFDRVMINYYPGIEFFRTLMSSTFIQESITSYQPVEMEAVPTAPILDRL